MGKMGEPPIPAPRGGACPGEECGFLRATRWARDHRPRIGKSSSMNLNTHRCLLLESPRSAP